jgi:hypothetical protein
MTLAYPNKHYRLCWGGRLGTTGEIWTCGLRLYADWCDSATLDQMQEAAAGDPIDDIAALLKTFHVSTGSNLSGAAYIDWVKLNAVSTAGLQGTGLETNRVDITTGNTPGVAAGIFQVALVASLMTAQSRGRAHMGRIYLPYGGGLTVDAGNGTVSASTTNQTTANLATCINAINDLDSWMIEAAGVTAPAVYVMSGLGTGTKHIVTGVKADNILDTQRRRRGKLVGTPGTLQAISD